MVRGLCKRTRRVAVERYGTLGCFQFAFGKFYARSHKQCTGCYEKRKPKEHLETVYPLVNEHTGTRSYCHGKIIAQAVEAKPFVPSRRRQNVYGRRAVGYGYRAKGQAVERSYYGEHQERSGYGIARKKHEEERQTPQQNAPAVETVNHVSAEKPCHNFGNHISRKHNAYHIV